MNWIFSGKYAEYVVSDDEIETIKGKKSYLLTNLISAICEHVGYDGIVYLSTKDENFVNYALFGNYIKGKEITCVGIINK